MKLILLILLLTSTAHAHGGEDHAVPAGRTAPPVVSGSHLKLVTYTGSLEVLVKYPVPELNKPVAGRIYFSEDASNHPVDPTTIEFSFPGTLGAKVTKQPTKVSDGVYSFEAVFIHDTNHTALLRYNYGDSEQLASLSPFYAGMSATRQVSASNTRESTREEKSSLLWILIPIAIALAVFGYVLLKKRRRQIRLIANNKATTLTTEPETTV